MARDKKGKVFAFKMTQKERDQFEIMAVSQDARLSNLESHVQDLKAKTEKISDKQDYIAEKQSVLLLQVNNWMLQSGSEVARINGTPDCPGIEPRLKIAEDNILKMATSIKVNNKWIVIGLPLIFTVIEVLFKFWK